MFFFFCGMFSKAQSTDRISLKIRKNSLFLHWAEQPCLKRKRETKNFLVRAPTLPNQCRGKMSSHENVGMRSRIVKWPFFIISLNRSPNSIYRTKDQRHNEPRYCEYYFNPQQYCIKKMLCSYGSVSVLLANRYELEGSHFLTSLRSLFHCMCDCELFDCNIDEIIFGTGSKNATFLFWQFISFCRILHSQVS